MIHRNPRNGGSTFPFSAKPSVIFKNLIQDTRTIRKHTFIKIALLFFGFWFLSFSAALAAEYVQTDSFNDDQLMHSRSTTTDFENRLPSFPFSLAENALTGTLNPTAANMKYNGKNTFGRIGFGLGYLKQSSSRSIPGGNFELASMLGNMFAAGTILNLYSNHRDFILNGVWQFPGSGFRFKTSGGYLWGNQNFNFPSGEATINLEQFSASFSTQYVVNDKEETGWLQSLGFSVWGAWANQKSGNPEPRTYFTETATDYLVMLDPLKLSEGRLFGAAADAQVALRSNLLARGSLGYETLIFPFSDGTRETDRRPYCSLQMFFEPVPELLLGAAFKTGAGENRISFSAETAKWLLSAFHNEGRNGISGNEGILLTYRMSIPAGKLKTTLVQRMKPNRSSDNAALLADAVERPQHLPQSFLAKVDLTAVKQTASISRRKAITSFTVSNQAGATIIDDAAHTITVNMPFNSSLNNISPIITITGKSVDPPSGAYQDFTNPVTYTVTAADGSAQTYTATVKAAANNAKTITGFTVPGQTGPTVIDETAQTVALTMPNGTDITSLTPKVSITGSSVEPQSDETHDFTDPVAYTVIAADGTSRTYTVTVTVAPDRSAKSITYFYISGQKGSATIDETAGTIAVTMPYGTDLTLLWPSISITGVSVNPQSDIARNFTKPVNYTVTAADGSTRTYRVTVTVSTSLDVGEYYGGGIVAYVDGTGIHGLIVTADDLSSNAKWSEAVQICNDLDMGGYSDWHLPNRDELTKIFGLLKPGYISLSGAGYWSSETYSSSSAYYLNLYYDQYHPEYYGIFIAANTLYSTYYVRAVRTF
jgi:hypothetical protein